MNENYAYGPTESLDTTQELTEDYGMTSREAQDLPGATPSPEGTGMQDLTCAPGYCGTDGGATYDEENAMETDEEMFAGEPEPANPETWLNL